MYNMAVFNMKALYSLCKILTKECAKVHSMKSKEYV